MAGFLRSAAAAVLLGIGSIAPQAGQRALTIYERPAPEYDGLGRKKRRVEPTFSRGRSRDWKRYAERVLSTHTVEGCSGDVLAHGLCSRHYQRRQRHGGPTAGGTSPGDLLAYLRRVVFAYEGSECLLWPYGRTTNGYAHLTIDGELVYAHRAACEHRHGLPPSPGHEAAHSCGNGHLGCVNQMHLDWKTRLENRADMEMHGTVPRGERHGNAKLTDLEVHEIRSLAGALSHREIAGLFGVSQTTVSSIIARRLWKHLPPADRRAA